MKYYQIVSILACLSLLLDLSNSFSPRPSTHSCRCAPLFYSDVAERHIAVDTQDNVQIYDSSHHNTEETRRAWQSLVPLIPGERGCDVTVKWRTPEQGSKLMLHHLFPQQNPQQQSSLQQQLQESFVTFQSLLPSYKEFKARVVATRGPSGTKCPRFHLDHVPMRWVQALVGPGCDYVVGSDGISWEAINGMEEISTTRANFEIVNHVVADVRHTKEGQGVVLLGAENRDGKFPAVHKSPTLGPFQGRVLLTLDVVRE